MTDSARNDVSILPDMGIPMPDGTRLSARVWMPAGAEDRPVPAIVEYLPYRKSDGTAARDHGMHLHFARAGYACLRIDRRGCGDSEGIFDDEYSEQELQDGVDALNWIAAQPWCTGRIGMQGISWGGFNGVQIAARVPEPLKAVISIGTTVDRYHDDIHYKGGVQLGENIGWAASYTSWGSMPPEPEVVGDDWRDTWRARLDATPFLAKTWTDHADRDAYWKHGSICESYDTIEAPVLVIGGQHDGYRNAMAAMAENLTAPVKAVMGPWGHKYPHITTIGPGIDYLGLALRWWDRWLKEVPNGADRDPAMSAYVMDSIRPDPDLTHRPGSWTGEAKWPSPAVTPRAFPLGDGTLGADAGAFHVTVDTDLRCGQACGEYFPFGLGPRELPDDQTPDDALSACFDTAPLTEDAIILGRPVIALRVAADQPRAQVIARLCDLRPDGTSALIALGLLNLRHRDGFEEKTDLEPGEAYDVTIPLDQTAYRVPAGHRLRLAISPSYWPYCWPEPAPVRLTLSGGTLALPIRDPALSEISFDPPIGMETRRYETIEAGSETKTAEIDPSTGRHVLRIMKDNGTVKDLHNGLVTHVAMTETWAIAPDDPATARVDIRWTSAFSRGDWAVRTELDTWMEGRAESFAYAQTLRAWDGDTLVFDRTDTAETPR